MEQAAILRSIHISGFKSFARPTRLELPRGIVALVGPNGSGKSNVVDAVRWCLGEQSMRELRGQRAEDVLYAGPRRRAGVADVALTFEGDVEMTVSRRLYGSGESEYLLDGARVRLRDVAQALRRIGIDAGRHVVVNQGMADALLEASPGERRALLEQAAGLAGYRTRRDEARQKLATTDQNVVTIELVLAELEPRLRSLRRQSRAVRERDEAASRLQVALRRWYGRRWANLTAEVDALTRQEAGLAEKRQSLAAVARRREEDVSIAVERERAWQSRLEMATAAVHEAQRSSDVARFDLEDERRRRAHLLAALSDVDRRYERLEQSRCWRQQELDRISVEREALLSAHSEVSGELEEVELRRVVMSGQVEEHRVRLAQVQASHQRAEETHRATSRQLALLHARFEALETRRRDVETRHNHWESDVARRERETGEHAHRLEVVKKQHEHLVAERARCEQRSVGLGERAQRWAAVRERARSDMMLTADALERVIQRHAELATEVAPSWRGLEVGAGWERAAAAVLGSWRATGGREPRTWSSTARAAFLRWRHGLPVGDGCWGDGLVAGIPAEEMSPLAGTLFVDSDETAEEIWRRLAPLRAHLVGSPALQVVSRSGRAHASLGVTWPSTDDAAVQYLEAQRRREQLERRSRTLQQRVEHVTTAASEAASRAAEEAARAARLGERAERAQAESRQVQADVAFSEREVERLKSEGRRLCQDAADLERERSDVEASLREKEVMLRQQLALLEGAADEEAVVSREASAALEEERATRQRIADVQRRQDAYRDQIAALDQRRDEQQRLLEETVGELTRVVTERQRIMRDREHSDCNIETKTAHLACLSARVAELQEYSKQVRAERPADSSGDDLVKLHRAHADLVGEHERLLARLAAERADRDRLRSEIDRELRVPADELGDYPDAPSDDEVRRLRVRAVQGADADPAVLAECEELEERYNALREHLADITAAANVLRHTMEVADQEMRNRFKVSFGAVDREFARTFDLMFGGGEARLEVLDDDGGIGVHAALPGRRAQTSAAFSGGERTLVAISLLFGVLRMRPTPFCILDEVDAALDERNVDRYLGVLRDISSRTQVIVVTHNRATMASADALYGLTMDGEGVSNTLSMRLDNFPVAG